MADPKRSDRDSSGKFVEGNHAREERVLTPEELEKVEKLVAGGARDSGVAKGLRISYRLFKYLKAERQSEEIAEALTIGEAVLHDALMHRMVRIALQTDDLREARMACESLLAMRFNYRSRGEAALSVNVASERPELVIIQERLDPSLVARITNASESVRVPYAPRNSVPPGESDPHADPRTDPRYDLERHW